MDMAGLLMLPVYAAVAGFEVINLQPMLENRGQHPQTLTIDFQATPFPEDWRAVVVLVEVSLPEIMS